MNEMLISRIEERMAALNTNATAAGLKAGSEHLIWNVLYGRSRSPRMVTIARIAKVLETTPAYLMGHVDDPAPEAARPDPLEDSDIAQAPSKPADLVETLPVRGTAAGAIIEHAFEGFAIEEERTVGWVRRPPALAGNIDAYGIMITGDSMAPLHRPGEFRAVNPHKTPQPGDTVIVITKHWAEDPGQAYIKTLRRRTQTSLVLEQLNPQAVIEIPTKYVRALHYVLSTDDMLRF